VIEENGKWYVYNKDGTKKLSKGYPSKKLADKRLREIEWYKSQNAHYELAYLDGEELFFTSAVSKWEESENEIRHRVKEPDLFESKSFRTKNIKDGSKGINIIVGKLKDGDGSMVVQSYRFKKKTKENKNGWTMDEAKKWMDKNK
jgi:hypothetical protein